MAFPIKYARMFMLVLAVSWPALASTAGPLPPQITGTWGMEKTPDMHGTKHVDMYLEANGSGMLVGSTIHTKHINGTDDEKSGPQSFISMPIETALQGDTLTTRPFDSSGRYAEEVARMTLTCHYEASGPTLRCADRRGVIISMQRRSETITADVAEMLAVIRAHTSGQ
jgi:hypothetical protein